MVDADRVVEGFFGATPVIRITFSVFSRISVNILRHRSIDRERRITLLPGWTMTKSVTFEMPTPLSF